MFEIIAVIIAFVGSAIAGIWDLFTTEVPDEVPAIMISLGIFTWFAYATITGNTYPLILSLSVGTLLLVAGLVLYRFGHWGGADAWLLAAIGYAIPLYNGQIFMFDFVFNFLVVGSIYMVIYALILGLMNRRVFSYFIEDIKERWRFLSAIILVLLVSVFLIYYNLYQIFGHAIWLTAFLVFLVFFWRYATIIDNRVFKRRIRTSKLKVGDVTEEMLWRGITAEEISKLKRSKRYVVIKEGVRFVPAFPLTLVVTLLFGNLMFFIL